MNSIFTKMLSIIKNRKILIINFLFIFWLISYLFLPLNITEDNASFEVVDGRGNIWKAYLYNKYTIFVQPIKIKKDLRPKP